MMRPISSVNFPTCWTRGGLEDNANPMPKLISESKEFPGLVFELNGPRLGVGRVDGNEVQIVHGSISSRHGELVLEGAEYRVRDLESTNGTRVNDEKTMEALLQDRDRVQFGQVPFVYEGSVPRVALALPTLGEDFHPEVGIDLGIPENFRNLSPIKGKGEPQDPTWMLWAGAAFAILGLGFYVFRMLTS
ncbi:FHA domain-containing protein [bacterium]|nr:FHA domain-containing protein [bacterium]